MKLVKKKVRIQDLKANFFVRKSLDEDHVMQLAEIYHNGGSLPLIRVTPALEIIDGRHRVEAYKINDVSEIEVEIDSSAQTPIEILGQALTCNMGGALPPSRDDLVYGIRQMVAQGATRKYIIELMRSYWPEATTKRYLDDAQSSIFKIKVSKAKEMIDNGSEIAEAAAYYGLQTEQLKNALKESKTRASKSNNPVAVIKAALSSKSKGSSRSETNLMKDAVEGFFNGDLSERQLRYIVSHLKKLNRRRQLHTEDWETRVERAIEMRQKVA